MSTKLVLIYALLLVLLSLTLSSCLFQKHTTKSSSSTDSTAYQRTESSYTKKAEEAWNKYLHNIDTNSVIITLNPDTNNVVVYNSNTGIISVMGRVGEVRHTGKKETFIKDSTVKQSIDSTNVKQEHKTELKKDEVKKDVQVKRSGLPWYVWVSGIVCLLVFFLLLVDQFTLGGVTRFFLGLFKKIKSITYKN